MPHELLSKEQACHGAGPSSAQSMLMVILAKGEGSGKVDKQWRRPAVSSGGTVGLVPASGSINFLLLAECDLAALYT